LEKILLNNARRRALKNNIQFSINIEDIIIPAMCPILNIPIILDSNLKTRDNSPSIDRLVPELGYTKENIRIISYRANTIKNSASIEEIEKILMYLKKEIINNEQNN
jgi:hypothetical protein